MQRIANASDPLKVHYSSIAYKPFVSLFNMTGVVANGVIPPAIGMSLRCPYQSSPYNYNQTPLSVNYAGSVVLEVRQPPSPSSEPVIRFNFKNGTDDDTYRTYPMRIIPTSDASTEVPVSTFVNAFQSAAINTTLQWCDECNQSEARGCAALLANKGTYIGGIAAEHQRISPVGAGFLGAGLTVVVYGIGLAVLVYLGLLKVGRGAKLAARPTFPKNEGGSAVRCVLLWRGQGA